MRRIPVADGRPVSSPLLRAARVDIDACGPGQRIASVYASATYTIGGVYLWKILRDSVDSFRNA